MASQRVWNPDLGLMRVDHDPSSVRRVTNSNSGQGHKLVASNFVKPKRRPVEVDGPISRRIHAFFRDAPVLWAVRVDLLENGPANRNVASRESIQARYRLIGTIAADRTASFQLGTGVWKEVFWAWKSVNSKTFPAGGQFAS